ncbi:MAG: peptide chain release factor N(5)-glutamine methyltransferase [Chitinophagaceae bacterium]|nr:peptide chain release factor N(5)-glutamine methyltransferase [Chitinophagaceae bacterium]
MTILQASIRVTNELKSIYEEGEASAISDWIIEYLTGIKRTDRSFHREKSLSHEQEARLEEITQRLMTHEPIQYVLNEAWFCGLKFYVDKNVLIPRPETEELVEWVIANCKFPVDKLSILDIGSGSGCIPIALKRKLRKAEVQSCDVSPAALDVAKENAAALGVDVHFFLLDFLNAGQRNTLPSFDIIISNPPYVPEKDKAQMQHNVLNFEPHTALFVPDNDALIFYKAIAEFGKTHLRENGTIYMEIHEGAGETVSGLFISNGYRVELKKDMQGKERMIRAFH